MNLLILMFITLSFYDKYRSVLFRVNSAKDLPITFIPLTTKISMEKKS